MAYNKAKEEKKWRLWKEAEEKQLRSLGVNEDDIEKLRVHDWTIFNSDRRYYQRVQETGTYLDELVEDTTQPEVKTVEDFLDSIENQHLYQVLIKVDSFPYADRPRQTSPAKNPQPADGRAPAGSTPYIPAFHIAVPSLQTPVPSLETPPAFLPRPARRAACLQRVLV